MSAKDIVLAAAGGGQTTTSIQYVGGKTVSITPSTSSNTTISLTDLTGSPSPSLQGGDIVIVSYVIGTSGTTYRSPNVTSNTYTAIATLFTSDTIETSLYCGYKIMGATPDTSVTVTPTTSVGRGGVVAIQAYRYVDEVFPIQQPANTATIANTVRPTPPTITPWDADSIAVIVGAGAHTRGNVAYTTTGLTSFITSGSTDADVDASIGAGFRVIQSGSYSPNRFNFPQTDATAFSSAALSVALKPKPDTIIPSFVSYRASQGAGTTPLTITAPTGIQENDFLLLTLTSDDIGSSWGTVPSGFTLVNSYTASGFVVTTNIYKKIATANEPATYTVVQSSTDDYTCMLSVFRNANTINTLGTATIIDSTALIAPSITPTFGGLNLVIFTCRTGVVYEETFSGLTKVAFIEGSGTEAQAIYVGVAAPYVATLERRVTNNVDHDSVSLQIQLTQE